MANPEKRPDEQKGADTGRADKTRKTVQETRKNMYDQWPANLSAAEIEDLGRADEFDSKEGENRLGILDPIPFPLATSSHP